MYKSLLRICFLLWFFPAVVQAQVIEDNSFATEVNTNNNLDFTVNGGERRGGNLFHSFAEFSIPNDGSVLFNNATTIENIITRVTGNSISNIDGLIRNNGQANLFLLNPNGIVFGTNARLDIGGSFVGSTAETIVFEDGTELSTQNNSTPLLTVSVPLGLQFGSNPGSIINRANFPVPNPLDPTGQDQINLGLTVAPNHSLALLGGDITFDGGAVTAAQGNIDLGSVAADSLVVLEQIGSGWQVNYDNVSQFRDIQLNNLSVVDISGQGSGNLQLRGKNIQVLNGSTITANTLGEVDGGKIKIQASELLTIQGSDPTGTKIDPFLTQFELFYPLASQISSSTFGGGKGGDIEVVAQNLQLLDGGSIELLTFPGSTGAGGNISIRVLDSITLQGIRPVLGIGANAENLLSIDIPLDTAIDINQSSEISTASISSGRGGNIQINTGNLSLADGAIISVSPFNSGDGGNIKINAQETIAISGTSPRTGTVGSSIAANTFADGNAGNIELSSDRLILENGAIILSTTNTPGNAGNIKLTSSEIAITGFRPQDGFPSLISTQAANGGNGGDITINAGSFTISDRAAVSVQGSARSIPGNLEVNANSLALNNFASIFATTEFQSGGNITLNLQGNLTLSNNSTISAQAFGDANGGNLDLTVDFLIVNPNENNDILATALRGNGGNITIRGQGIFGIEERSSRPPNRSNDIDASSEFGVDGTVILEFGEFAEFRTLAASFRNFVNLQDLLGSGFCENDEQNRYSILGKGGMALIPEADLSLEDSWSDWRFFESGDGTKVNGSSSSSSSNIANVSNNYNHQLEMIRGWIKDRQGRVVLTANPLTVIPYSSALPTPDCQQRLAK